VQLGTCNESRNSKEFDRIVDEVRENLNGKTISYEALKKMKLLEMILNETLRKWPPLAFGIRECNKDYKYVGIDGMEFVIKEGESIIIPFRYIQHDPKYFKNPSEFNPQRFSDENKNSIVPGSFITFGYGPR
jgi:cytochrome P450 family 9